LPSILEAAADHGAKFAAYSIVRLPGTVADVFENWLERHQPMAKEKILGRIRAAHDGKLNGMTPGVRMRGSGAAAEQTRKLFQTCARKHGLQTSPPSLNLEAFRRLSPGQQELF
jgi:DNA repair photolyase